MPVKKPPMQEDFAEFLILPQEGGSGHAPRKRRFPRRRGENPAKGAAFPPDRSFSKEVCGFLGGLRFRLWHPRRVAMQSAQTAGGCCFLKGRLFSRRAGCACKRPPLMPAGPGPQIRFRGRHCENPTRPRVALKRAAAAIQIPACAHEGSKRPFRQ